MSVKGYDLRVLGRNLGMYLVGLALAVTGALGLADAIELPMVVGWMLLIVGLVCVIIVHEWFDGPF